MRPMCDMLESLAHRQLTPVPISRIRCEKKLAGIEEGWGGKGIEAFPPYGFFKLYGSGHETQAIEAMEDWYHQRLIKRRLICMPKKDGGMAGGSLFREIAALHRERSILLAPDLGNADEGLLRQAIRRRVQQRFVLFRSIRQHGQRFAGDYVRIARDGEHFTLIDGHHRVAALAVCGQTEVLAALSESLLLKSLKQFSKGVLSHRKKTTETATG